MARKPNYDLERKDRERAKAAKVAAKAKSRERPSDEAAAPDSEKA